MASNIRRDIEKVQATYEDQLMKLDGVKAIGICHRDGEDCIMVYTDKPTRRIKINDQDLEGYKIVYDYYGIEEED